MGAGKSDYQFEIRLNGIELMKGDASSIGVIFGNLDGRNFDSSGIKNQSHAQWLSYMAGEFNTPLEFGSRIEMLNPEGEILSISFVGKSIDLEEISVAEQAQA